MMDFVEAQRELNWLRTADELALQILTLMVMEYLR